MKFLALLLGLLLTPALAYAHFATLLIEPPIIGDSAANRLNIQLAFTHPRAAQGMDMAKPLAFAVWHNGQESDLRPSLQESRLFGSRAWSGSFTPPAPGDYIFYTSPAPYWEEAEQCFIAHYSKTVVNAYAMQGGWDHALGLPVEIIPLTRPYGLYPGNIFSGQVLQNGQPLADCPLEIEFFDPQQLKPASNDSLITQVLKTDAHGYFSCSFPWPGWWGMAALAAGGQISQNGRRGDLEVGGVLWLHVDQLPE